MPAPTLRPGQWVAALLQHEPSIVRGLGRFHGIRLMLRVAPQLPKHGFVFFGRDPLLLHAPAHRHQEEHRPHGDPLRGQQVGDRVHLVYVAARDAGVHLYGQAQLRAFSSICSVRLKLPSSPRKASCVAASAPSRLMPNPCTPASRARWKASNVAKGVADGVSATCNPARRVANQREQVGPFQRIAAGHHQRRSAREAGHLIQQRHRLRSGKLARGRLLLGRRPAMLADQVACERDLVVEHQWADGEILTGIAVHRESLGRTPTPRSPDPRRSFLPQRSLAGKPSSDA